MCTPLSSHGSWRKAPNHVSAPSPRERRHSLHLRQFEERSPIEWRRNQRPSEDQQQELLESLMFGSGFRAGCGHVRRLHASPDVRTRPHAEVVTTPIIPQDPCERRKPLTQRRFRLGLCRLRRHAGEASARQRHYPCPRLHGFRHGIPTVDDQCRIVHEHLIIDRTMIGHDDHRIGAAKLVL